MLTGKAAAVARGVVVLMALAVVSPLAAGAQETRSIIDLGEDQVIPDADAFGDLGTQASDPLGLVPFLDIVRTHSLGTDVIDVWTCDIGVSVGTVVAQLDSEVAPYFQAHSHGRYQVDFVAKGAATGGQNGCLDTAADNASGNANGVLIAGPWSGGLGGPGHGESWPSNNRWALVGYTDAFSMVAAHELGHTQTWPHSFTGTSGSDYDNALDVMSGNYGTDGNSYGTFDLPYATAVINRYAAGWIDESQVAVVPAGASGFRLEPFGGSGIQMAVIKSGSKYFTLGARSASTYDPIPNHWQGVEVYEVTPCPYDLGGCFSDSRFDMGFREHVPLGRVAFDPGSFDSYSKPLSHVISAGKSKTVGGRSVSVEAGPNGSYDVSVSAGSGSGSSTFVDTAGSVFLDDIEWLAATGITKGCNPPMNDRFCPDEPVTRGQMAAFLHRALADLATGSATDFVDDDNSTFESDIEWLSATGVTRGCNPPTNDRFCPTSVVTRGQMAAFLHRALPDLAVTGTATDFIDDDDSTFESDIEWLAATGVTRGCNPPANTQFCPDSPVTRGAMAAFLHRALDG